MILILTEQAREGDFDGDDGEQGGRILLPVLQLDSARQLEHGTRIRTAGGEVFIVEEDFENIAAIVDALLAPPDEDPGFDAEGDDE